MKIGKALDFKIAAQQPAEFRPPREEFAALLAQKYDIENEDGLADLIRDIERQGETQQPLKKQPLRNGEKLVEEIARHCDLLRKHAQEVLALSPLQEEEALLLAGLRIRSPQWSYAVIDAIHAVSTIRVRKRPLTPHKALLRSLLFTLLHFGQHQENLPHGDFVPSADGPAPDKGTIAEFVVDALAVAGWEFTDAEVAAEFWPSYDVYYAQLTSEEGEVPIHDDKESKGDTDVLEETGWIEEKLHSYLR